MRLHSEHDGPSDAGDGTDGWRRLALVHGFAQTCRCWGPVADDLAHDHEVVRIDAPGHGGSSHVRADLPTTGLLLAEVGPAVYVGYSMGGRMALHVALGRPEVVQGLVLIGATPGIEEDRERAERRARDQRLAQRLRVGGDDGVAAFVSEWLDQPLFAGLPAWARFEDERRRNTAEGLAASLELAGTGSQAPLWSDLPELTMPVLLVTGADDTRYTEIAARMAETIGPHASLAVVPDAGHAAHLEQPEHVTTLLRSWLVSPRFGTFAARTGARVATMTRPTAPPPPPATAVQVTARADAHRAREWWAKWDALPPVEPARPAAEVLAEVRDDDT